MRMIPRSADEAVLTMLKAKCAGATWAEAGSAAGKSGGSAEQACRNVRSADVAESGESDAAAGYW